MFDNGCMLTEIAECLCFFVTTAGSEKKIAIKRWASKHRIGDDLSST